VGAGFFSVLNQPVVAGREFGEQDERIDLNPIGKPAAATKPGAATEPGAATARLPMLLNQKAARALFGNTNAIGKHLRDSQHSYEVVGIVPDVKDAVGSTLGTAYLPLTRQDFAHTPSGGIVIVARGHSAEDALGGVRSVVASMDPNLTLFNVQTLSEYLELTRASMRAALRTFGGIGLFGLILSAIGLAGVTAYAVAQRSKEIGIRMALGARKSQVLALVLREGATLVAVGTLIGFLGSVALAKAMSAITTVFSDAFSFGVGDPRLLIGAPLLLAGLAMLACYIPARRALAIDPLKALRLE
jgi:ABC-type antimicrobial peptide transport system permease subunit